MKKLSKYLMPLVMAFVTVVCTSCVVKDSTISNGNTEVLKGNISILSSSRNAVALKYAAESFTKENPKVNIEIKINDKLNTVKSISDIAETPDIFIIDDEYAKYFIKDNSGKFIDLSQYVNSAREKYPKWKLSNLSEGGIIYGSPWNAVPMVIYYRNDIFKSEQINPEDIKTWDDFIEAAGKISKDTSKKILSVLNSTEYPLYKMLFLELSNGVVDKDGKPSFSADKAETSIKLVKKLQQSGFISEYSSEGSLVQGIANGNVVSFISGPEGAKDLKNKVPGQKNLWSIMLLPGFEPGGNRSISIGGANFFVPASTKNKQLVLEFIKYANEDTALWSVEMKNNGIFPANEALYDLNTFNVSDPYFNNQNIWQIFSGVEKLTPENYYPDNYGAINQSIETAVKDIMAKKEDDIKTPLQELKKDIESSIK